MSEKSGRITPPTSSRSASPSSPPMPGRRVATPVVMARATVHPFVVLQDAVANHVWRREALDAYETHSFTGSPGTERWCARCTLMLAPDWKDPKKPVPLPCGDPRITPVPAVYEYSDGNPVNGLRLADPQYAGAKTKEA